MPIYNKRKTIKYLFQFFTFNKVACKLYINVSLGFVECDPRHITETKFFFYWNIYLELTIRTLFNQASVF